MLTIFTHCKPFRGHIGMIQRNAIGSWTHLRPRCEVVLFGDREGTAATAKEFGVRHVPEVAKNQYGAPLLNDLLRKTEGLSSDDLLCYVNCDIVFGHEFMRAVDRVSRWRRRFLLIGECWNLDVLRPLTFDVPEWEQDLECLIHEKGQPRGPFANDYFVFPRGFYGDLPAFALGRAAFDHWLIWKARAIGAPVVDATRVVLAVHQNHDYSHVEGGKSRVREGEEGRLNMALAGGREHCFYTWDATHRLRGEGIHWSPTGYFRLRSHKSTAKMIALFWWATELTRPTRDAFGLRLSNLAQLWVWVKRRLAQ